MFVKKAGLIAQQSTPTKTTRTSTLIPPLVIPSPTSQIRSFKPTVNTKFWPTYTNIPLGFSFLYDENKYTQSWQGPGDPSEAKPNQTTGGFVFSLNIPPGEPDISIYYWPSINEIGAKGGYWSAYKYRNLIEYFTDSRSPKKKMGEFLIDGKKAYQMINTNPGINYQGLMIEHNGGIYEIDFPQIRSTASTLTDTQRTILSTFKFTR